MVVLPPQLAALALTGKFTWTAMPILYNFLSHFYRFLRRAGYLLIAGAFFLIGIFFIYRSLGVRTETVFTVKVVPVDATSSRRQSSPVIDFDSEVSYYRPIIEYNLFRPLGWTPPRPSEPYRLIGTVLATDANTPPQAILQTTAGNTTYIVTTGEKIDASTEVISIESKQVTLSTNGQQRTLRLNTAVYLNPYLMTVFWHNHIEHNEIQHLL